MCSSLVAAARLSSEAILVVGAEDDLGEETWEEVDRLAAKGKRVVTAEMLYDAVIFCMV